jgi:hypothetical protein
MQHSAQTRTEHVLQTVLKKLKMLLPERLKRYQRCTPLHDCTQEHDSAPSCIAGKPAPLVLAVQHKLQQAVCAGMGQKHTDQQRSH